MIWMQQAALMESPLQRGEPPYTIQRDEEDKKKEEEEKKGEKPPNSKQTTLIKTELCITHRA